MHSLIIIIIIVVAVVVIVVVVVIIIIIIIIIMNEIGSIESHSWWKTFTCPNLLKDLIFTSYTDFGNGEL